MDNDPDSKLSEAEDKCEKEETEVPNTTPVDKDAEFDIITQKDVLEASGPQAIQESLLVREEGAIDEAIQQLKDSKITDKERVIIDLVHLRAQFHDWTDIRTQTILKLRSIAEYVDTVSHRTGVAKIVGSGGGALAGGLTLIGGALTIASMGVAFPVLLAGTSLGLASGITGGAAAITDKILKSRQLKEVEAALLLDQEATKDLEEKVYELQQTKVAREIAKDVALRGAGAASDSLYIAGLVSGGAGAGGGVIGKVGTEAMAKIFGEDVGKEISKLLLHTSGRIISGSVTVVLGGVTMLYDIYKLSGEVTDMAKLGEEGASEIRTIADQLEEALLELCYNKSEEMRQKEERIQHLEDEGGDASALNTDENSAIGSETSLNAKKDPEQVEDSNSSSSDETEIGDVENTP